VSSYGTEILRILERKMRLNDTTVMQVLYLLRDLHGDREREIRIIDSHYVVLACEQRRATEEIRRLLSDDLDSELILMPVFLDAHWSLLFFAPYLGLYMHLDSCAPYHASYSKRLVTLFDPEYRYTRLVLPSSGTELSQQVSSWECGLFLLMNAYMMIVALPYMKNNQTLVAHLTQHMSSISETNRPLFTRIVIKIVRREVATTAAAATTTTTTTDDEDTIL
jgi:hypothetical protein